ncbi:MAG TPA: DegQ family serine endoprotease [Candidatus Binatia bacterium]|jgi:serine protease Do|nr:DegQ family serine endoprotease [Candidatus Binatia bacterium]
MEEKGLLGKKVGVRGLTVVALVSLLIGLGISGHLDGLTGGSRGLHLWGESQSAEVRPASPEAQGLPDFINLAKKMRPLVVNISTVQVSEGGQGFSSPFGEEDPFSEFWRRFFGGPIPRGPQQQRSLGSGFIIDSDGSILTNNHVVENAQKIVVKLSDEREFEAKVVGKDSKTDIAVVKIDARGSLPIASLGDSDRLEVGEWVMAIGNPFGLDSTITAGIVSAKGRHIGAGPYDDFIQTDASINPGNSGGPLINLHGEVVGINSAIFSRTGGNIGIGFAIPINLAKELLPQLKGKGKVTRGYLGVLIQKVTPDIAESLGLEKARGALVANVSKDGPADRAGIKVGDVIIEFDGKEIKDSNELPIIVARTAVNKKARLKVLRDKKEVTLAVAVGELKEEEVVASTEEKGELGLAVQRVTPEMAESLGLERAEGVVITAITQGGPADEAGLRRGDVILEIDRKPVRNLADYKKAIGERKGKGILFLVRRGDNTLFLALKPRR